MLNTFFLKTDVKKNLFISVLGIGLGQIIHLISTPIISRLYTPEEFGVFSLFMSLFGILSALSLMKFELAIIVCKDNEVGILDLILKRIGLTITVLTILSTSFLYYIDHQYKVIFFFLSLIIFISNRFWTQRAIVNREQNFKALSVSKILENFINSFFAISLVFTPLKDIGLFLSKFFGMFFSYIMLKRSTKLNYDKNTSLVRNTIFDYQKFPIYSFPAELISHFNQSTTIFLFTYLFFSFEVGLIGLTARVLSVPANFISVSFFDVYKQKAIQDFKAYGSFTTIFKKFFVLLSSLSLIMISIISSFGPEIFKFVFGAEWEKAGIYAQYLTILYAIKLIAVPLTFSLEIRNKHYINLIFQTLYLVVGITTITIVYSFSKNDILCIKYYSFVLSFLYAIHIYLSYRASKK